MSPELIMFHRLLELEAENYKFVASLWEADPERYGTTIEGAADWRSRGLGIKHAADLLKRYLE